MIHAIVLIVASPDSIPETAQFIAGLEDVSEVYSVAGRVDLVAVVRVREHERLAEVVTHEISKAPGVTSTETLIAFRAYSRHDLEGIFTVGWQNGRERGG